MKNLLIGLTLLTSMSTFASTIEDDLINSQKEVISLQKKLSATKDKLVKSYKAGGICYSSKSTCLTEVGTFRLLSNSKISIDATCAYKEQKRDSVCADKNWISVTRIRIINN